MDTATGAYYTLGFAVAIKGCEHKVAYEFANEDLVEALITYVNTHKEQLADKQLGLWWSDDGYLYLDVVDIRFNRSLAVDLAIKNEQQAIYDLENNELIYISR